MDRIRQLRTERGFSQAKLAVMAGMDPATLNRLEQSKGNPNLRTLERVAEALGVSVAELLEDGAPKAQAPLFLELPDQVPAEERRLRYLRALDLFAAQRAKYWAVRAERNEFSEQQFQEELDTFRDYEDAFVRGLGIDLLATFRDAEDAVPAPERETFQGAKASLDAWCATLWNAFDALKARGATNVEQLDDYRTRLERAESGRRSA
jgi:transcriptional regulator with XRE-family HTH domain